MVDLEKITNKHTVNYLEGREDILKELLDEINNEDYDSVAQIRGAIHMMITVINKVKKDYV